MSYEKPADFGGRGRPSRSAQDLATALRDDGLVWLPLRYHKRPVVPATALDLLCGVARGLRVIAREPRTIVHARSHAVSALIGWLLKRLCGVRFVFDMRGFWADERAEAGQLRPGGVFYRVAKRLEHAFLRDADEIVTLTNVARAIVERRLAPDAARVTVIPTCVDLERFPLPVGAGRRGGGPVMVYAGSVGTLARLDEMLRFFATAAARFPAAHLRILTRDLDEARHEVARAELPPEAVTLAAVPPAQVPSWLAGADAGLALYRPGWGRQGMSPTKVAEYLATGLPVVVNDAVGDMPELIGANDVGVVLGEFSPTAYGKALDDLERLWDDTTLAARCRAVAERHFSLRTGVERYWAIYERLA